MSKANENRKGYKNSQLGWIPEEWGLFKLKDIGKTTAGGTPSTRIIEYWGGEILWMNSGELNYKKVENVKGRITDSGLNNSSTQILPKYCILIGLAGQGKTRGTVAYNVVELCTNQSVAAILPNKDKYFYKYLFYNFDSRYNELRRLSTGDGGRGGLNLSIINSLLIPLPPLPEQKKIAQILSTWDDAISNTEQLIEKLKLRKKGLMQELLTGKTRLKGFTGKWKTMKLGDVSERISKKNTELNDTVVTISAKRGFVLQEDFFNKRVASDTLSGYYLIEKGEFAYNKSYSKGYPMGAFKRLDELEKAVVTTLYICFKLTNRVDSDFMVNYFEGGLLVNNIMKIAQEGGRAHGLLNISLGDFFSLEIKIPELIEQKAIAEILTTVDEEIKVYEKYLSQLQSQKKGLMQKLLTGEVRVNVDEEVV